MNLARCPIKIQPTKNSQSPICQSWFWGHALVSSTTSGNRVGEGRCVFSLQHKGLKSNPSEQYMDSGTRIPGLSHQPHCLLAMQSWTSQWTCLHFSFLICTTGIIMVPSESWCRLNTSKYVKCLERTLTQNQQTETWATVMRMMRQNKVKPCEDPAALPSSSLGEDNGGGGKGAEGKKRWHVWGNRLSSKMATSKVFGIRQERILGHTLH